MTPHNIELVFKSMILYIVFIDWLSLYAKDDLLKHKRLSYDLVATVGRRRTCTGSTEKSKNKREGRSVQLSLCQLRWEGDDPCNDIKKEWGFFHYYISPMDVAYPTPYTTRMEKDSR